MKEQTGNPGNERMGAKRCGPFIKGVALVGCLVTTMNIVTVFFNPSAPHLLTSVIPDAKVLSKWKLLPFVIIHGYIWCTQWTCVHFYCTWVMVHMCTVQDVLQLLK